MGMKPDRSVTRTSVIASSRGDPFDAPDDMSALSASAKHTTNEGELYGSRLGFSNSPYGTQRLNKKKGNASSINYNTMCDVDRIDRFKLIYANM